MFGSLSLGLGLGGRGAASSGTSSYASWPSLVGAERILNGGCGSDVSWNEGVGVTVNVVAGKMVATAASSTTTNDGFLTGSAIVGITYRCAETTDSVTGGSYVVSIGGTAGATRSTAASFSQDLVAASSAGWQIVFTSATMQLDNLSVVSIGLLGPSTYWTMPAGSITWDTATQGIKFEGADDTQIVSITGDGLTAFATAVSLNTAVLFRVFVSGFVDDDAFVRIHNGSWVALNIAADGWSTPVAVTTGAVAGLEFSGNVNVTAEFIIRACDIDLA